MPELAGWRPANQTHSIQQAGLAVAFTHPIGDVAWRRIDKEVESVAMALGLNDRQQAGIAGLPAGVIQLLQGTGANFSMEQGAIYRRRSGSEAIPETLQLMPSGIRYDQTDYVRWAPMKARFHELASQAIGEYALVSSLANISADYVDVFTAIDPMAQNDISTIISEHCPAVARIAFRNDDLWHTHSGWFDYPDPATRRLANVFIDVEQAATAPGRPHTLRIRTTLTDQFGQPGSEALSDDGLNWEFVESHLQSLHVSLKEILRAILTPAAADAISLA